MILTRRFVLGGLLAAPAVVAATNIMPVRSIARLMGPTATIFDETGKIVAVIPVVIKHMHLPPFGSLQVAEGIWPIVSRSVVHPDTASLSILGDNRKAKITREGSDHPITMLPGDSLKLSMRWTWTED
jgi:hypothetical protein